ncbi:hypothetical protein [uncultured Hyphomicrobium sp.]|uniref:hypothetical protein n=1 Tax=uncultured Hyphomicrobium sp. TaxID=194373 RepID=UPI0025DDBD94|nr:hypothetical protein [uncultured Hyphomicrobium sp.]
MRPTERLKGILQQRIYDASVTLEAQSEILRLVVAEIDGDGGYEAQLKQQLNDIADTLDDAQGKAQGAAEDMGKMVWPAR